MLSIGIVPLKRRLNGEFLLLFTLVTVEPGCELIFLVIVVFVDSNIKLNGEIYMHSE